MGWIGRPRADIGLIDRLKDSRVTYPAPHLLRPGRQSTIKQPIAVISSSRRARRSEAGRSDQGPRQDPTQPRIMQVKVKTLKGQMVEVPTEDATLVRVMCGVFACFSCVGWDLTLGPKFAGAYDSDPRLNGLLPSSPLSPSCSVFNNRYRSSRRAWRGPCHRGRRPRTASA